MSKLINKDVNKQDRNISNDTISKDDILVDTHHAQNGVFSAPCLKDNFFKNCTTVEDCINEAFLKNHLSAKDNSLNDIKITKFFDASSLRCPMPLLKTKEQLKTLAPNNILLVKTTDPSFQIDIKVFAKKTNHKILKIIKSENAYFTLLQKEAIK